MIINISSIREERGVSISFAGMQEIDPADFEGKGLKTQNSVEVKGKATNTGDGFLVEAEFVLKYKVNCDRCLQEITKAQKVELKEEFVSNHHPDASVYSFDGDMIDLSECLRDQALLALPMKFLCNPDCKGVCPSCGKNLNLESCRCEKEKTNHQFEILKDFFPKEGGGANGQPKK